MSSQYCTSTPNETPETSITSSTSSAAKLDKKYASIKGRHEKTDTGRRKYGYQPQYATTLKPENGGRVLVNSALVQKPEYAEILFGKLTDRQELLIHLKPLKIWAICWSGILLYVLGYIPCWLMCLIVFLSCINYAGQVHASTHSKTSMPFPLRMTGLALFCSGFMPFAGTVGDVKHEHIHEHHLTKGPLDPSDHDRDSRWSHLPMWQMVVLFFINPSHSSAWEIVAHQYIYNPAYLWPERIALNIFHWAQLVLLYKIGGVNTFFTVLATGHVAMALAWCVFHGFVHRPDWYKFIIEVDPSGLRKIHPIVEFIGTNFLSSIWLEIKWHDVHHTHGHSTMSFEASKRRGFTSDEINTACANLVDEGLFVDSNGNACSPLAEVGHKVGSRKAYLAKLENKSSLKKISTTRSALC